VALTSDGCGFLFQHERMVAAFGLDGRSLHGPGSVNTLDALAAAPGGQVWCSDGNEVLQGALGGGPLRSRWKNSLPERSSGLVFGSIAAGKRWAVAGRRDGLLFLFDVVTGRFVKSISVCQSSVLSVALAPDERQVLAGTEQGRAILVDLPSG